VLMKVIVTNSRLAVTFLVILAISFISGCATVSTCGSKQEISGNCYSYDEGEKISITHTSGAKSVVTFKAFADEQLISEESVIPYDEIQRIEEYKSPGEKILRAAGNILGALIIVILGGAAIIAAL
jgi:hypothetical protein